MAWMSFFVYRSSVVAPAASCIMLVFLKSLEFQNGMALYINNIDVCVVSFMRLALAVSTKPLFEPIRVS